MELESREMIESPAHGFFTKPRRHVFDNVKTSLSEFRDRGKHD